MFKIKTGKLNSRLKHILFLCLFLLSFLHKLFLPNLVFAQQTTCRFLITSSSSSPISLNLGPFGDIDTNTSLTATMNLTQEQITRLGTSITPHVAFKYEGGDWTFIPASYNSATNTFSVTFTLSQIDDISNDFPSTETENFTRHLQMVATSGDANTQDRDLCLAQTHGIYGLQNDDDMTITTFDSICAQQLDETSTQYQECMRCYDKYNKDGVWTAFGCFNAGDQNQLIQSLITLTIGLAGGIAVLLILFGSFTISTSASNPEKLKLGQEVVTAAITGLLFIILSVAIMQFIGVEIFRIPGL